MVAALLAALAACSDAPAIDAPAASAAVDDAQVLLPFLTNRAVETDGDGRRYFGNEPGSFSGGRCSVAIDGAGGALLAVEDDSAAATIAALTPDAAGTVVAYFHGYYEDFERSCRRAAIFKHLLGRETGFLLFSWPANSTPLTYRDDVADLEASTPLFLEALDALARRFGAGNIRIVGHSLGSRGLVQALKDWPAGNGKLGALLLVAADIDRTEFEESLPVLREHVDRLSVLVSDRDLALKVSQAVNQAPRLGQPADATIEGVPFVDVSAIAGSHFSGHIYHLRDEPVVERIRELLR